MSRQTILSSILCVAVIFTGWYLTANSQYAYWCGTAFTFVACAILVLGNDMK